ncbi:hypothetical protein AM394_02090 [Klebsiella oxytoca]|nr:hypothetical protein AM394_02090 [Klebsiella oxytoca]
MRAVPCIHRSRAVVDTWVKCTRRSSGPSYTSAAIFRSFDHSSFTVSPFSSRLPCRQAAASFAPLYPRLIVRLVWMHGTARFREICDSRPELGAEEPADQPETGGRGTGPPYFQPRRVLPTATFH